MNNETITTFTEITVEQAGEMLRDNGWKPVSGVAFMGLEENGWNHVELRGIQVGNGRHKFQAPRDLYATCATVTEINPCVAPDGCPKLEPWMAFVGNIPTHFKAQLDQLYTPKSHPSRWGELGITRDIDLHHGMVFAIDVRTAWAQEHFPEHCRIRNYQEPAKYGYHKGELIVAPEGWELVPEGERFTGELWYVTDYECANFKAINHRLSSTCLAELQGSVIGYFRKIQEPDPKHDAWVNFATNHRFDVGDHDSFK